MRRLTFLLVLVLLMIHSIEQVQSQVLHNGACSLLSPCKTTALLKCLNRFCVCDNNIVWSTSSGTCVSVFDELKAALTLNDESKSLNVLAKLTKANDWNLLDVKTALGAHVNGKVILDVLATLNNANLFSSAELSNLFARLSLTVQTYKNQGGKLNLLVSLSYALNNVIGLNNLLPADLSVLLEVDNLLNLALTKDLQILVDLQNLKPNLIGLRSFLSNLNLKLNLNSLSVLARLSIVESLASLTANVYTTSNLPLALDLLIQLNGLQNIDAALSSRLLSNLLNNRRVLFVEFDLIVRNLIELLKLNINVQRSLLEFNISSLISTSNVAVILQNVLSTVKSLPNVDILIASLSCLDPSVLLNLQDLKTLVTSLTNLNGLLKTNLTLVDDLLLTLTDGSRLLNLNEFNNLITEINSLVSLLPNNVHLVVNALLNLDLTSVLSNSQIFTILSNLRQSLKGQSTNELLLGTILNQLVFLNINELLNLTNLKLAASKLLAEINPSILNLNLISNLNNLLSNLLEGNDGLSLENLLNLSHTLNGLLNLSNPLEILQSLSNLSVLTLLLPDQSNRFLSNLLSVLNLNTVNQLGLVNGLVNTLNKLLGNDLSSLETVDPVVLLGALNGVTGLLNLKDPLNVLQVVSGSDSLSSLGPNLLDVGLLNLKNILNLQDLTNPAGLVQQVLSLVDSLSDSGSSNSQGIASLLDGVTNIFRLNDPLGVLNLLTNSANLPILSLLRPNDLGQVLNNLVNKLLKNTGVSPLSVINPLFDTVRQLLGGNLNNVESLNLASILNSFIGLLSLENPLNILQNLLASSLLKNLSPTDLANVLTNLVPALISNGLANPQVFISQLVATVQVLLGSSTDPKILSNLLNTVTGLLSLDGTNGAGLLNTLVGLGPLSNANLNILNQLLPTATGLAGLSGNGLLVANLLNVLLGGGSTQLPIVGDLLNNLLNLGKLPVLTELGHVAEGLNLINGLLGSNSLNLLDLNSLLGSILSTRINSTNPFELLNVLSGVLVGNSVLNLNSLIGIVPQLVTRTCSSDGGLLGSVLGTVTCSSGAFVNLVGGLLTSVLGRNGILGLLEPTKVDSLLDTINNLLSSSGKVNNVVNSIIGGTCTSTNIKCNSLSGLICSNKVCACPIGYSWKTSVQICAK